MGESADSTVAANRAEAQLAAHRAAGRAANRLLDEQSPYLLQHAYNPVDWYPWGDAAFDAARAADKPVFVSIGYATCHWCHVMERESFENPEIAALMNEHFVNVKIDREERPDVDRIYMTVVQALTGSGGWPLSVFLTPERQPFYAGTYYPPRSAFGRPGFVELLTALARQWREKRAQLTDTAARITAAVAGAARPAEGRPPEGKPSEGRPSEGRPSEGKPSEGKPSEGKPSEGRPSEGKPSEGVAVVGVEGGAAVEPAPALLPRVAAALAGAFDQEYGGFGAAPKFPRPAALTALLHHRQLSGDQPAQTMAVETLVQMARGGMYDQLGGGFHRYSVDRYWRVPHFEKMLYDQAQLVTAYVQAYQATGERLLGDLAAETLEYVLRDLRAPEGGFYSAEDADSELIDGAESAGAGAGAGHRIEGAFYMWTAAELRQHLGSEAERFAATYGVTEDGNTLSDPHDEFADRNVLYRTTDSGTMAPAWRAKLWPLRERRPRPLLDDKIIAGWNGLTISALALAGAVLQREDFVAAGAAAAEFVLTRLIEQPADRATSTRLLRRFRNGEARHPAGLADYAFVIGGLLDQYGATGDISLVTAAESLADTVLEHFVDADGALYDTPAGQPDLIVRTQELYDGAEPSGTASAIVALGRLGNFGAARDYAASARTALAHALPVAAEQPSAAPLLALAADLANRPPAQVVLTGSWESAAPLRRELTTRLLPGVAVLHLSTPEALELLGGRLPEVAAMIGDDPQVATEPQAFVCRDFVCELPVASAAELAAQLSALLE